MRCSATTRAGERCKREAKQDGLCRPHAATQNGTAEKEDWRPRFLEAFAKQGLVLTAARQVGISRSTVYRERQANEDFALAWAEIEEWTTEEMEQEARRRAVLGVSEAVYHRGTVVGHIRKFSDTLLIFLLKARKPEMYREKQSHEHSGPGGAPISFKHGIDLSRLSEEELREYRDLTARAQGADD